MRAAKRSGSRKAGPFFYPHEEVIRFVSKYIKKKVGIHEFVHIKNMKTCLDLGCGIGRHVLYFDDMEFEAYGIDLSEEAISFARKWFINLGKKHLLDRLHVGSITDMPYDNEYFDFIVSHGVLDSMPFHLAKQSIYEVHRVLKKDGLFYFDLISGGNERYPREYSGEEVVKTKHEKDTIQSYFNWGKINKLIDGFFTIEEAILVQRESVVKVGKNCRYHIVARKSSN